MLINLWALKVSHSSISLYQEFFRRKSLKSVDKTCLKNTKKGGLVQCSSLWVTVHLNWPYSRKNAIFPALIIVTSFSNQAEYLHSTSNILSNYAQWLDWIWWLYKKRICITKPYNFFHDLFALETGLFFNCSNNLIQNKIFYYKSNAVCFKSPVCNGNLHIKEVGDQWCQFLDRGFQS